MIELTLGRKSLQYDCILCRIFFLKRALGLESGLDTYQLFDHGQVTEHSDVYYP